MDPATPADSHSPAIPLELDTPSEPSTRSDTDSAISGIDSASRNRQTVSATESVYEYRYESGRRYHAYQAALYPLPNDEPEQDRLDLQHHAFRVCIDGPLYIAPIQKNIQNVLDVGCGTGIWAIEFAEEHPSAAVLGIDLSPIQPLYVPVNCSFRVDNAEADWIAGETYDFIHVRAMIFAIKNWPRFIEQAFRHLRPGGYIELQDLCLPTRCDDPLASATSKVLAYNRSIIGITEQLGFDTQAPLHWHEYLQAAGFTSIFSKWYNWPVGPWAKHRRNKELGKLVLMNFYNGMDATGPMFEKFLGYTAEEAQVLVAEVRKEFREQKVYLYQPCCFCYARNPPEPGLEEEF